MEERKTTSAELKKYIEEWGIKERIREKISFWGIRSIQQKIAAMPLPFLQASFLYHFHLHFNNHLIGSTSSELTVIGLHLKQLYNQSCLHFFKRQDNFEYTLVILAKLMVYFLSTFLAKKIQADATESQVYMTMVTLLIGYDVDSNAYRIIEQRFQVRNIKKRKQSLKCLEKVVVKDENDNGARSNKRLHRKGLQCLYRTEDGEIFRLEVQDALFVKNGYAKSQEGSQIPVLLHHQIVPQETEADAVMGWVKGKSKVINANQISAALAINKGLELSGKTKSEIHLSKRRKLKEFNLKEESNEGVIAFATPICQEIFMNATKQKNWSRIVEDMKKSSKNSCYSTQNQATNPYLTKIYVFIDIKEKNIKLQSLICLIYCKESSSRDTLGVYHLRQQSKSLFKDLSSQYNTYNNRLSSKQDQKPEFKALNSAIDQSIHCHIGEPNVHRGNRMVRKSNSIFYTKGKQQFDRNCNQRHMHMGSKFNLLPKLQKT